MSGERILIVEDERAVARGLEYGLQKEGFITSWAPDGKTALDLARTQEPHLILLDIRLPDISGFDVCRILRQDGHRMPILMLTARGDAVDRILGLELGADDYLSKPFDPRELAARIRAVLRRASAPAAASSADDEEELRAGVLLLDLARRRAKRFVGERTPTGELLCLEDALHG